MNKLIMPLLTAVMLVMCAGVSAREFHDTAFADSIQLPGSTQSLQLNGIGYRSKFFIKVYIGALYTETKATTRDAVQTQTGSKRMLMHFLHDEVSSEKLVNAWNEGFVDNNSAETMAALRDRIARFNAMFPTLHAGDVVWLDYIPGKGTVVTIKGEDKGTIEGADFNRALLDIWLGEEPADDGLKDALLRE
jgi:hypothetical protein